MRLRVYPLKLNKHVPHLEEIRAVRNDIAISVCKLKTLQKAFM